MPKGVTPRKYEVSAIQANLVYNDFGDHDPNGLLFVMKGQEYAVRSGKTPAKPLTIRANMGDVIEVTLTNRFTKPPVQTFHPGVPVIADYPPSERVSLHAALVSYDPTNSDGATVGFNPDQTVCPGDSITYRWYADKELGACLLTDMGDIYSHRGHGLWGGLIIEPEGSVYLDVKTGKPLGNVSAQSAIIKMDTVAFREFALFMQDGIDLYDKCGEPIPDAVDTAHGGMDDDMDDSMDDGTDDGMDDGTEMKTLDFEDQGQKGFNYRSERFANRFEKNDNPLYAMSSRVHGDPATPLLEAYAGEDVKIRLLLPSDKPRNHSFVLHGHSWLEQPDDPLSPEVSTQSAITVGSVFNIELKANCYAGDYAYRSGALRWDVEQGMWGLFRIYNRTRCGLYPINKF